MGGLSGLIDKGRSGMGALTGSTDAAEASVAGAEASAAATLAASQQNIDFQKWLWGEQTALQQPYMDMGAESIGRYQDLLNEPIDPTQDPGYQFGLNEGQRSLDASGASKGMQLSGRQVKRQQRFGTDYASTKYNESFNRRQVNLDNLYRMINSGQAAASGVAAQGTSMGSQVSSSIGQAGQANAQMYSDIGNIRSAEIMAPYNSSMDTVQSVAAMYAGGG